MNTWGQNLHHHPHVHAVVTGGGLSCNSQGTVNASPRWVACRPGFFLFAPGARSAGSAGASTWPGGELRQAFDQGQLVFPGKFAALADVAALARWLTPLSRLDRVIHAERPFGGAEQVLKYLARHTHRGPSATNGCYPWKRAA